MSAQGHSTTALPGPPVAWLNRRSCHATDRMGKDSNSSRRIRRTFHIAAGPRRHCPLPGAPGWQATSRITGRTRRPQATGRSQVCDRSKCPGTSDAKMSCSLPCTRQRRGDVGREAWLGAAGREGPHGRRPHWELRRHAREHVPPSTRTLTSKGRPAAPRPASGPPRRGADREQVAACRPRPAAPPVTWLRTARLRR